MTRKVKRQDSIRTENDAISMQSAKNLTLESKNNLTLTSTEGDVSVWAKTKPITQQAGNGFTQTVSAGNANTLVQGGTATVQVNGGEIQLESRGDIVITDGTGGIKIDSQGNIKLWGANIYFDSNSVTIEGDIEYDSGGNEPESAPELQAPELTETTVLEYEPVESFEGEPARYDRSKPIVNERNQWTEPRKIEKESKQKAFVAGFTINNQVTTLGKLYYKYVSKTFDFKKVNMFELHNKHLRPDNVLPGEMVIFANHPKTEEDKNILQGLQNQAKLASEGIQQLTEAEATAVYNHLLFLDYVDSQKLGEAGLGVGVISAIMGQRLDDLKVILEELNQNYLDNTHKSSGGGKVSFNDTFYQNRQRLFGQLDNTLQRLTMNPLKISNHPHIKHTLGLSSKSIIHNWDAVTAKGEVPELGRRIRTISLFSKGASATGWMMVAVDGLVARDKIREACTGEDVSQCEAVSFHEVGGLAGSTTGGVIGGKAGSVAAVGAVEGIAILLGVTVGGAVLAVAAVAGVGIGAYLGSKELGNLGKRLGDSIYSFKVRNQT
ncbi:hypothetical protein [Marinomonas mediterranea]|uniref:hypothetical protein n=1 Tax=Marinomonas mediterranea TaxID=119864 RepID=UPI00234A12C6|nr:hypothetical protein [Marinomonas mediterranea]WCN07577.1 hypothetical protein GV055_00880 [Marinomonas mediterranea]